jgi:Rieske Fe-S protein
MDDEDRVCLARRGLLVGGLATLGGLALAGCSPSGNLPSGPVQVGPTSAFGVGTWTLDASNSLIIARDSRGIYAYSAICTHAGCEIDAPDSSGRAACPCHGSMFDGSGAVLRGPAGSPLAHFQVTIQGGMVVVDATMTVSADLRAMVA